MTAPKKNAPREDFFPRGTYNYDLTQSDRTNHGVEKLKNSRVLGFCRFLDPRRPIRRINSGSAIKFMSHFAIARQASKAGWFKGDKIFCSNVSRIKKVLPPACASSD